MFELESSDGTVAVVASQQRVKASPELARRSAAEFAAKRLRRKGDECRVKEKKKSPEEVATARQRELEKLEKEVDDLKRLAGDEDADAELERLREQVAELRQGVLHASRAVAARADRAAPAAAVLDGLYSAVVHGFCGIARRPRVR